MTTMRERLFTAVNSPEAQKCDSQEECLVFFATFIEQELKKERDEIVEMVENKRKEFWLDYHNAQKWSEQKAVADSTDDIINTIKQRV